MRASPAHSSTNRASLARRAARGLIMLGICNLAAGCNFVVMDPSGDVAVQQRNLIIASTALMLLVVLPVIALTFLFARQYRASNADATYDPEWHHSTQLEVVIWTIPLLIVMALGAMAWISTHTLDPFRPLSRLGPKRPIPAEVKPLDVQVVALDWKWLFIYPEYGIAGVNEMAAPANRPISFRITSSSVWNTFYVPALAGMIYAMPGMETKLHAVMNQEGTFRGLSGHYSGLGFSRMTFAFKSLPADGFDQWVSNARAAGTPLDRKAYVELEKPSVADPVRFFGSVEKDLFEAIVGLCAVEGQMCVSEMHHIDKTGGGARESEENRKRLDYDNRRLQGGTAGFGATVPASGRPARSDAPPEGTTPQDEGGPAPAQLNPTSDGHKH
jgi:cytochrome o ubiquinol oxidase subunit II